MDAYEVLENFKILKKRLETTNSPVLAKFEEAFNKARLEMSENGTPLEGDVSGGTTTLEWGSQISGEDKLARIFVFGLERIGISNPHQSEGIMYHDVEIVAFNGFQYCTFLTFLTIIENFCDGDGGAPLGLKFSYEFLIKKNIGSKIDSAFMFLPMYYPWISASIKVEHWQASDEKEKINEPAVIADNEIKNIVPEVNPNSENSTNPSSTEPVKRKVCGKRLVFLILAIFFGIGVIESIIMFIDAATGADLEPIPIPFLFVFYLAASALFWWLFLRKETASATNNKSFPSVPPLPPASITQDPPKPSSEVVKSLIALYQCAQTQEERNKILYPLFYNLCHISLMFLVLYESIEKPVDEIRSTPLYDVMKPASDAKIVPMVRRFIKPIETQDGKKFIPLFTDYHAYQQSGYPQLLNKMFMEAYECFPEMYLPMLKDLSYDGVVINPDSQNHFFPKELFEMLMAKGVDSEQKLSRQNF